MKTLYRRLVAIALIIGVWVLVAWVAARFLIVNTPLHNADAIVVMSGSAVYRERTQRAAEYYRQGLAPRILLTNDNQRGEWSSAEQRNPFFYERARNNLLLLQVPGVIQRRIRPRPLAFPSVCKWRKRRCQLR